MFLSDVVRLDEEAERKVMMNLVYVSRLSRGLDCVSDICWFACW